MRVADILRIAISALLQQKVRTLLTMAGVVIGTFALAMSLSLGRGFEAEVIRQVNRRDQLRQVMVWPSHEVKESEIPPERLKVVGDMSDAKRERLRKTIIRRFRQRGLREHHDVLLTTDRVRVLRQLDHVESVRPILQERLEVKLGEQKRYVLAAGVAVDDDQYRSRLVAGSFLPANEGPVVMVGEYLLYRWGITSEAEVNRVIGQKLHVVYRPEKRSPTAILELLGGNTFGLLNAEELATLTKALRQLPLVRDRLGLSEGEMETLIRLLESFGLGPRTPTEILSELHASCGKLGTLLGVGLVSPLHAVPVAVLRPEEPIFTTDYTIGGVLRELNEEDEGLSLTYGTMIVNADLFLPVEEASKLFLLGEINRDTGFDTVVVIVDREQNVKEVSRKIKEMGLKEFSLGEWMDRVRVSLMLGTFVTSTLAFVALLVAGLGITNTMIMSVLERRREIGVMKAVGGRDSHIQLIFLVEGGLIGGIGGVLGMLACWLASFPGDSIARHLLAQGNEIPLKGTLFVFPLWLTLGVPVFACLVTTLAAFYPARRAARVDPIAALRHE